MSCFLNFGWRVMWCRQMRFLIVVIGKINFKLVNLNGISIIINYQWQALVKISQNVIIPFTTTCNLQSFGTRFGNICNYKTKFQLFWSFSQRFPLENFIPLVGSILRLFLSINRLICPISCNSHQISCILKIFYNDKRVH